MGVNDAVLAGEEVGGHGHHAVDLILPNGDRPDDGAMFAPVVVRGVCVDGVQPRRAMGFNRQARGCLPPSGIRERWKLIDVPQDRSDQQTGEAFVADDCAAGFAAPFGESVVHGTNCARPTAGPRLTIVSAREGDAALVVPELE